MAKKHFRVFHASAGDHIAVIEMDEDLLAPEAGILDHKTMTLRSIKNGGMFTLLPVGDHTVNTLRRVKQVYDNTKKGAEFFSTHLHRIDELASAVGLLFGDVEYIVVESKDDLDKIINPPRDDDYEPKKVKYTILGDMLTAAMAAANEDEDPDEKDKRDKEEAEEAEKEKEKEKEKAKPHVHGPNCNHGK